MTEVMSPAGYWPQLMAAIEAGADSVYFGLTHFSARAKVGFTLAELPEVMRTLHRRGVRGFVTYNTLVYDSELNEAARGLEAIASSGADAVIVQDWAVLALARRIAPSLEVHASTQMSVTDAAGARLAARLGARRVTLARELSLDEIRQIRTACDVELEVFVHGALCVAYSGQCFSSEAWGGRSANRGQCAQACRLPYSLFADGANVDLGDARYLLSPGDLFALDHVPALIELGVAAFKIEGRYKDAAYVAAATRAYRAAVDGASLTPLEKLQLEQVYSRGMGPYFIQGVDHQAVVRGRAPRHRGVLLGTVTTVTATGVRLRPTPAHDIAPLKPGDGIVFDAADWRSPEEPEEGGRVYSVSSHAGELALEFANRAMRLDRIRAGDLVWRTDDPALEKLLKPYLSATAPLARQPVVVACDARAGAPLRLKLALASRPEIAVEAESDTPLEAASKQGLDEAALHAQMERLGGTPYQLRSATLTTDGRAFVPASLLNRLRRTLVERLSELQGQLRPAPIELAAGAALSELSSQPAQPAAASPRLHVLARTPAQLEAALAANPASITLDYLDLYGLRPSLDRIRDAGIEARVATPRILKPGEDKIVEFLLRLGAPLLVRPAGLLDWLAPRPHAALTGDFSLNAANAVSAAALLSLGLDRLTPTHDLNGAQITALARQLGGAHLETIVYQHLPVFHTEHCVFCRFLSSGTSYKDCGRPCDTRRLELADDHGRRHEVMADIGCRNTVFGAEAQHSAAWLDPWREAGIAHFRVEFAGESREQAAAVCAAFNAALAGRISATELEARLRRAAPGGTTEGSLRAGGAELTVLA